MDPAVWAPVERSFGEEHNGSQSAKWAWGEVQAYASDGMHQIAGRTPLGTTFIELIAGTIVSGHA